MSWLLIAAATVLAPEKNAVSPTATALAEALIEAQPSSAAVDAMAQTLARNLLSSTAAARGRPCDRELPACRAAAERLAREEAPIVLAYRRAARVQMQAVLIQETMSPQEITASAAFARTSAGKALVRAIGRDSSTLSPAAQQTLGRILMRPIAPDGRRSLLDRFYDATEGLPRGEFRVVPPPPMPSSNPRKQP